MFSSEKKNTNFTNISKGYFNTLHPNYAPLNQHVHTEMFHNTQISQAPIRQHGNFKLTFHFQHNIFNTSHNQAGSCMYIVPFRLFSHEGNTFYSMHMVQQLQLYIINIFCYLHSTYSNDNKSQNYNIFVTLSWRLVRNAAKQKDRTFVKC